MEEDNVGFFHYFLHERKDLHDLVIVIGWAALTVSVLILLPRFIWLRTIFSIPFLLFLPGYILVSAFWPKGCEKKQEVREGISVLERLALSFGLSVAIIAVIVLGLNFTPWGIRLYPIMGAICCFIVVFAFVALFKRMKIPKNERFSVDVPIMMPNINDWTLLDKVLSVGIVIVIIAAFSVLYYVAVTPAEGVKFTQLYILNDNEIADNYPTTLTIGENATVRVGVICNEWRTVNYTVVAGIENATQIIYYDDWSHTFTLTNDTGIGRYISLDHENKFEQDFNVRFNEPGRYKLMWQLYMDGKETDREVHLWVDVRG
jgi:uncharacterized membrane protein